MKIIIDFAEEAALQNLISLKDHIDESSIEDIDTVEINEAQGRDGQLAVGEIMDSITLVIKAASKPLTELVKSLQEYVKTFRTSINIELPDGTKIKIDKGKNTSADEIVKIIEAAKK